MFIDLGEKLNGELTEFIVTENELFVLLGANIIKVNLKTKEIQQLYKKNIFIGAIEEHSQGYLFTKGSFIINSNKSLRAKDSLEINVFDNYKIDSGIQKRVNISSNGKINLCHFLRYGRNEFYEFDFSKARYRRIKIPSELKKRKINHSHFHEDKIWFSTDLGVYVCQLFEDDLILFNIYFKNKFVTKIIKDNNSNYWAITKGDGIYVIPNINIYQYGTTNDNLNITNLEKIRKNLLVFGTTDGKVGLLNSDRDETIIIDSISKSRVSQIKNISKSNETFIIKEDLVYKMNNESSQYRQIKARELIGAKSFSKINDTAYVVSSYKRAKLINNKYEIECILVNKRSYVNYYSETNKSIYVGTVDGLFLFDNALQNQSISYKNSPIYAKNIVETDDHKIWISTFKDGIFGVKGNKIIDHFNTEDGLLSKRISTIKNDGNNLWISTDEGIQYLNTLNRQFKSLTKQDGIPSYRISDIEIDEHIAFFTTNTGVFSVNKNKVFKDSKVPQVYISDVSIGLKSAELKEHYELAYDENSIKISFNANGFNSFLNNRYQFRLLGQNDKWQTDESGSNSVDYYNLPSGNYTFEVKSVLANEDDNTHKDSINFIIKRPFWEQWWFYVVVLSLVGLAIYSVFKAKIKKFKNEQAQILQKELVNKQLVLSQLENLRSQMNPHFIFNALNSIQEYVVFNEKELASSYLIKFSRLIRIYLEHSRENEVLLSEEINALSIYLELEKNRFEDVLEYKITIDNSVNVSNIKIPSLFIQPYVENALKHGLLHKKNDRKLSIDFALNATKDILYCNIKDNGIGVEASKALNREQYPMHKSFATSANEKRVNLLNSNRVHKISVTTKSTEYGTEVSIVIAV